MTCKEIGEYVEEQRERDKQKATQISSIGYRLAEFLIFSNGMCVKRPKIMKFDELFPEIKIENNNSKEDEIQNKWKEFLRGG